MGERVQIITEVNALNSLFRNESFRRGVFLLNILKNHSYLTMAMSEEELNEQWADSESTIRKFCASYDLPKPRAEARLAEYWKNIDFMVEYNPMAIWLLDLDCSKIEEIKKYLGIWAVEAKNVADIEFTFQHQKKYHDKVNVDGETNNGWKNFIADAGKEPPVFNSLIIEDKYLLYTDNEQFAQKNIDDGLENTLRLLDSLLPTKILAQIQILVLCRHPNVDKEYVEEKIKNFVERVKALRNYNKGINIDFAFGETPHDRNIYFNYCSFNADRGFNAFRPSNTTRLSGENKFDIESYLNNPLSTGDSNYKQAVDSIKDIKNKCHNIIFGINNTYSNKNSTLNYIIFDPSSNDDTKINNRLFA